MKLDRVLLEAGIVAEAAVIGLVVFRRIGRKLPLFLAYCVWALVSDGVAFAMTLRGGGYGLRFYFGETAIDSVLQFVVFVELVWSVLQPLRRRLLRNGIVWIAGMILAASVAIWPFAGMAGVAAPSLGWQWMMQLQQTVSILRILFFVGMAGCSQLLALGWRDRELQVATGFGFYSLVSIAVAMRNAHVTTATEFSELSVVVSVSFLASLLFWAVSFGRQDVERREFTPGMQRMVLRMARAARIAREDLPGG